MSSSYNINNLYTKPAILNNTVFSGYPLTVDATAGGVQLNPLLFSQNDQFVIVDLDVQTADVYVTYDGSTPAAGNGHILKAGNYYQWSRARAKAAKFIRVGSTSATIYASPSQV